MYKQLSCLLLCILLRQFTKIPKTFKLQIQKIHHIVTRMLILPSKCTSTLTSRTFLELLPSRQPWILVFPIFSYQYPLINARIHASHRYVTYVGVYSHVYTYPKNETQLFYWPGLASGVRDNLLTWFLYFTIPWGSYISGMMGFSTCYDKIGHYGILSILSWVNLGNAGHRKDSLIFL